MTGEAVSSISSLVPSSIRYVYRAIDQHGQVIDVLLSARRDAAAARRFFCRALKTLKVIPSEVVTDAAPVYPAVLDELLAAAWYQLLGYALSNGECFARGVVSCTLRVISAADWPMRQRNEYRSPTTVTRVRVHNGSRPARVSRLRSARQPRMRRRA